MNNLAMKQVMHLNERDKLLIDIYEASDLLGLKVSRIRMAVFRKEIPYRKIGGLVRFVPEELRSWVNSDSIKPPKPF